MPDAKLKVPRAPRNPEQATELLERVAQTHGMIARINADRAAAIAATNAVADALLVPVVAELDAIAGVIEAWWMKDGHALLKGKRKTLELGGCKIGTKAAPLALTFGNSDDFEVAVERLREQRAAWAKPLVRAVHSVDKTVTKEALDGKHGQKLRELGFGTRGGSDVFVLTAAPQPATVEAR